MSSHSAHIEDQTPNNDDGHSSCCGDEHTILCSVDEKDSKESCDVIRVKDGRRTKLCTFKSIRDDGQLVSYEITETQPTSTLEETKRGYIRKCEQWKNSECWKDLEIMLRCVLAEGHISVDNCVLLGSGSPSSARFGNVDIPEGRERTLIQFAVFCSVASLIASCQKDKAPKLFAQEPRFNDIDREFCQYLGIQSVEHPEGFEQLTTQSFAYCPGAEQIVDLRCFSHGPALYLGGEAEIWNDNRGRLRSRFEGIEYDEFHRMVPADESYGPEDALCAQAVKTFMSTREEHVLPEEDGTECTWLIYRKNPGSKLN